MFELLVREQFHRASIETLLLLQMIGVGACLAAITTFLGRLPGTTLAPGVSSRFSLLIGAVVSFDVIALHRLWPVPIEMDWIPQAAGIGLALAVCWLVALRFPVTHWSQVRRACVAAFLVFVCSQWAFAALRAPTIVWPAWQAPSGGRKSMQIFLLFDELNADAMQPILDVLVRRGIDHRSRQIDTVGDSTAKVVPVMFGGGDFESAKACGTTSICGSTDILDFSKVTASRPDVDIVGFYMPYCAIKGLRHCERLVVASPLGDWRRWVCAGMRRLPTAWMRMSDTCGKTHSSVWGGLINDVETAILKDPVWTQGGFLFAHVPLPHPPGRLFGYSLKDDYRDGVERAARLVDEILGHTATADARPVSLVIFSDHPLRIKLWCESLTYAEHPCRPNDGLADRKVPLIVAGDVLPDIDAVTSNARIFALRGP